MRRFACGSSVWWFLAGPTEGFQKVGLRPHLNHAVTVACTTEGLRSTGCLQLSGMAASAPHSFTVTCQTRRYVQPTRALQLEVQMNPASGNYVMEHAFEEPTLRFLCEGHDVDYKNDVRQALRKVFPNARKQSFTQEEGGQEGPMGGASTERPSQTTLKRFRALCNARLISFAQARSTPQRLSSFYETVATADPALAMLAADHFTAAGMLATHGRKSLVTQDAVRHTLDKVDAGRSLGCLAQRELIADGTPYNTEARFDAHERCFVLRGTGKFAVPAAENADWAILAATLTLGKNENNGAHLFYVPLRGDGGALRKGVSIRPLSPSENAVSARAGVAVMHFEDVRIPEDHLLKPFHINKEGKVDYLPPEELGSEGGKASFLESLAGAGPASAVDVLGHRTRLATAAIYVGIMKKLMTDIVYFIAQKDVVGFDHRRNYPYFGLQHVQTPLVSLVAKGFVYLTCYQRLLPAFAGEGSKPPKYEDYMELAGTVHFLQQTINELVRFAHEFMGVHASLTTSGMDAALTAVHFRNEGPDQSALIREVAFKSISRNIGTSHWGWWATSLLQAFPSIDRFIKNPMYSPRIAELGRHLIFFSHKHYGIKTRLRRSREFERRKGGSEHQWYDWVMFRHREVVHCGEAFMEMRCVEAMMAETQNCSDPRGRKILRDLGWIFALARQMDRLDCVLSSRMMSANKAVILASHLDNLVTVMAPQCVNLVDAMQVPTAFRAPCGAADIEPYWTIPGTNTHIQRGDRVTLFDAAEQRRQRHDEEEGPSGAAGRAKAEQESMKEEEGEFDLFHGLADEPSYKTSSGAGKTNRT